MTVDEHSCSQCTKEEAGLSNEEVKILALAASETQKKGEAY